MSDFDRADANCEQVQVIKIVKLFQTVVLINYKDGRDK